MDFKIFDLPDAHITWCPGCGNFAILTALKQALSELGIPPEKVVLVSGIGQAAKLPHFIRTHIYNGLHGRALCAATAIKAVNPDLTVIAIGGDGDMYGEGGNHFIHTVRRNPDITLLAHNNMVYGLTKGQASPTSPRDMVTPAQVTGVHSEPFKPIAVSIALDCSFIAQAFAGDIPQTKDIIKKAIVHKGFSHVDIFQPCVSFNKINTYTWFKEHTYYLESSYDHKDRVMAFQKATMNDKYPLGVIYCSPSKPTFEEVQPLYFKNLTPLAKRSIQPEQIEELMAQHL